MAPVSKADRRRDDKEQRETAAADWKLATSSLEHLRSKKDAPGLSKLVATNRPY
jgi:hypothetical protein